MVTCGWCGAGLPSGLRRDAIYCTKRCRQARHRFATAVGAAAVAHGRARRLAYADPPYPGNARLYRDHPDYGGEVDHQALVEHLAGYDGWALSTSAAALPAVLRLCPPTVRVAAWHRGERPHSTSPFALNAWEPVIYVPVPGQPSRNTAARRVDSLVHGVTPTTTRPGRVLGAKPAAFCRWLFNLLGAAAGDAFDDLFPGSGAVADAWEFYTSSDAGTDASRGPNREASRDVEHDASRVATGDGSRALHPRMVSRS